MSNFENCRGCNQECASVVYKLTVSLRDWLGNRLLTVLAGLIAVAMAVGFAHDVQRQGWGLAIGKAIIAIAILLGSAVLFAYLHMIVFGAVLGAATGVLIGSIYTGYCILVPSVAGAVDWQVYLENIAWPAVVLGEIGFFLGTWLYIWWLADRIHDM